MTAKLINKRSGFATNSSSSHSIILTPPNSTSHLGNISEGNEFGWDWFLQQTFDQKLNYIMVALDHMSDEELIELLSVSQSDLDRNRPHDGYIDHDSVGLIDSNNAKMVLHSSCVSILGGNDNSDTPDWAEPFMEIDDTLMTIIENAQHTIANGLEQRITIREGANVTNIEAGVATTFNNETGEKLRFSLNGDDEIYLSTPELVDIKITDYCPYGCSYCYQDSTVDGVHADKETLFAMVDHMKSLGVFELAIGGGEPTLYPHFLELLEYASPDIIPNFTTRNLTFFKQDINTVATVFKQIGGFAYSVDTPSDVERYYDLIEYWYKQSERYFLECKLNPKKILDDKKALGSDGMYYEKFQNIINKLINVVSFQVVLGVSTREEYQKLVDHIDDVSCRCIDLRDRMLSLWDDTRRIVQQYIRDNGMSMQYFDRLYVDLKDIPTIMLLGYKTTGRGSKPVYDYHETAISDVVNKPRLMSLGIDTAAAQQMSEQLKALKVDETTYYIKEGVASCYIDAVNSTMSASSYGSDVDAGKMDTYTVSTFIDNFGKYQHTALSAIPLMLV